ncbi:MAG: hypothetical protein U0840_06880 [Gemmataceae bacterium]
MAPPDTPRLVARGDDPGNPFQRRLFLITAAIATLLVTVWLCTLGSFIAILALTIAKHILVAILIMGLGVDAAPSPPDRSGHRS